MTQPAELPPSALQAMGGAIQDMTAICLGGAFVPLAAGAMLANGLRVVRRGFGRPEPAWMALSPVVGVLPLGLGLYVVGWRGLRGLSAFQGIPGLVSGVFFTVVGAWVLHAWVKLVEVARLADTMVVGDGTGGAE